MSITTGHLETLLTACAVVLAWVAVLNLTLVRILGMRPAAFVGVPRLTEVNVTPLVLAGTVRFAAGAVLAW
jgi:hypothetical protein